MMKDHEKRNLVTDLCAIAVQCHDSESLRDRIAHCVLAALDAAVAAARADERERCAKKLEARITGDNNREDAEVRRCIDAIRKG